MTKSRSSGVIPSAGAVGVSSGRNFQAEKVIETIDNMLQDRDVLKKAVVQCFKKVDAGPGQLDVNGLQLFRIHLSQALEIPTEAFGDLMNSYICFDFDGSGLLTVNETYKLVKFSLREFRKLIGGSDTNVKMPFRTMQEAGYTITKELGRGSQGVAKLAVDRQGREVCVKLLQKSQMSAAGIDEMREEFQTLQNLACDAISQVFELFQDNQFYYMVGEPYLGGDFMTLKSRAMHQGVTINESWFRDIARQCCEALRFMHEQAIMHCDIKEPNIMLKTTNFRAPKVVIIDFGVCRAMVQAPNGMPGGTPGYMPPETLETKKWHPRGDVFAMGVTLLQVVIDKMPPLGARTIRTPGGIFIEGCLTVQDMFNATRTRQPPMHLVPPALGGLRQLLGKMLVKQMQGRPTARQVLEDPWLKADTRTETPLRSKSPWATVGITKSFLERASISDEATPAIAALHALRRTLGASDQRLQAKQLDYCTPSDVVSKTSSATLPARPGQHVSFRHEDAE